MENSIATFYRLREIDSVEKKPATRELINWIRALDADPDFIWIDSEHMPYGAEALETLPVLIRQRGVAPMIRVAWNDPAWLTARHGIDDRAPVVEKMQGALRKFASEASRP